MLLCIFLRVYEKIGKIISDQYFVSKNNDEPVESFYYPVSYSVLYTYLVALMYNHLYSRTDLRRTWILQGLGLHKQLIEHGQNISS